MHFIEQLFGSAPDGGNGAFESLLLIFPFLIALWKMKRKPVFGWLGSTGIAAAAKPVNTEPKNRRGHNETFRAIHPGTPRPGVAFPERG
jgi:hypothetical protein